MREEGENAAANEIAQLTINIVQTFNNATTGWHKQKFFLNLMSTRSGSPDALNETIRGEMKKLEEKSWAAVAATAADKNNRLIKFGPGDSLKRSVGEESESASETLLEHEIDLRVIWVMQWPAKKPLSKITERIHTGPLFSMAYSEPESAVCIIFQHAAHGKAFWELNFDHEQATGSCILGHGCHLMVGRPYPLDENLKRMEGTGGERRRLTFVRSQLFVGLSEERFKQDIYEIVGESNVELVWLFNTGNGDSPFLRSKFSVSPPAAPNVELERLERNEG